MIKKYKVGVLGCAHIAIRSLLPAFSSSERFELAGIASRDFTKPNLQLPLIIVLLTVAMKSCWIMRISNWYIFRFRQACTMSGSIKLWKRKACDE